MKLNLIFEINAEDKHYPLDYALDIAEDLIDQLRKVDNADQEVGELPKTKRTKMKDIGVGIARLVLTEVPGVPDKSKRCRKQRKETV